MADQQPAAAAPEPTKAPEFVPLPVPVDMTSVVVGLQTKLEKDGWKVRQIKTEDGCYEAYAVNTKGQRMETFFNPKTLEAVGDDNG